MDAGINHFIFVSAVIFILGAYSAAGHKNILRVVMGIILMLTAPIINFAAFSGFRNFNPEGQIIIFITSGICILLLITGCLLAYNYFRHTGTIEIEGETDA
ncbi:MAG: NADH-quinone oxidoreductase subunit K [Ignavibacteria bacterium]|nr:NADH-quinone oxidoreductase subunit K [Ignavibacteria bacterium]MCC7159062.1 NADH-quinone oxidoreductase subunit K [Ignavibacteria bacterium]